MRICFYEEQAQRWEPIALTRGVFDLWCGAGTLLEKGLARWRPTAWGVWLRPALEALYRRQHPDWHINDAEWLAGGDTIAVNAAWLPGSSATLEHEAGRVGDRVVYVRLKAGHGFHVSVERAEPVDGVVLDTPWELVDHNGAEITRDFEQGERGLGRRTGDLCVVGDRDRVWLHPSVRIDPMVAIDTTAGPVLVDAEAIVFPFSRLEGPCYIGKRTQIHGAKIRGGTTLGPQCRIGGEVEASIVHGYSNKYHEGFLGHSYVGEWVNLGAGTHNSDLRNDYGEVAMIQAGVRRPSGLTKVGCFLGDHTKTGLGTLINTGTNVGVFCNLLPAGRLAPKYVPSFMNWWNGSIDEGFPLEQLLETARTMMARRGVELSAEREGVYRRLYEETGLERQRVVRDRYRRSA